MVEIALYEPLIPQNTGNIGRLCVGFESELSLIGNLGFSLAEKEFKRAGLDYWQYLKWHHYLTFEEFYQKKINAGKRLLCLSKFGEVDIYHFDFQENDIIMGGSETTGVPDSITEDYGILRISIPIKGAIRSYNLANSIAMSLSEANRKISYKF